MNASFPDLLTLLRQDEREVQSLTASLKRAQTKARSRRRQVQEFLRRGASSGDPVTDFLLCAQVDRDDFEPELRRINQDTLEHPNEVILVVERWLESVIRSGSGHYGDDMLRVFTRYQIGVTTGEPLSFNLTNFNLTIPTTRHYSFKAGLRPLPTEGIEGSITIDGQRCLNLGVVIDPKYASRHGIDQQLPCLEIHVGNPAVIKGIIELGVRPSSPILEALGLLGCGSMISEIVWEGERL